MKSEILIYSRSRGLFAGISLKGAVLRPDKDANKSLYGKAIDIKQIVDTGAGPVPEPAKKFVESVSRATAGK